MSILVLHTIESIAAYRTKNGTLYSDPREAAQNQLLTDFFMWYEEFPIRQGASSREILAWLADHKAEIDDAVAAYKELQPIQ